MPELQKIHRVLWEALERNFDSSAVVTHAEPQSLVFRPAAEAQPISLRFDNDVWAEIRDADFARLEQVARNVEQYVMNAIRRYADDRGAPFAFRIDVDDHALDE